MFIILEEDETLKRDELMFPKLPNGKINILVNALRLASKDVDIIDTNLVIPDECEQYGFAEGRHNLGLLLCFLADMLEE